MSLVDILLLAFALSIDATVASFAQGLVLKEKRLKNAMLLATFTGLFQAIMPILGYYSAKLVVKIVAPMSEWLVFVIFLILGLNFIKEAIVKKDEIVQCLSMKCLFVIAIATSIDAYAAGASIAFEGILIIIPALIIGLTTFIMSLLGFLSGKILTKLKTMYLEIFAGLILILLAFKTLLT